MEKDRERESATLQKRLNRALAKRFALHVHMYVDTIAETAFLDFNGDNGGE
jgi:hypothetical protein